jgi:post-segregation antitoxin (ccd killing protein)
MRSKALTEAIERAGGVNALARALGISSGAVAQWRDIPPRRLAEVARATGQPGLAETRAPFAAEAAALGLDAAAIAGQAVREAIGREKARRWAEENRAAIEAHRRYVEEHGLPLDEYRQF